MTGIIQLRCGYTPPGLGQLILALDPAYQYGTVTGTSNQPKLGYLLTCTSDLAAGTLLTVTADGAPIFSNHAVTVAEVNNSDIVNSGGSLSQGIHVLQATLTNGAATSTSNQLVYTYDASIGTPTITGTSVVSTATPSYTITWGSPKPSVGDTLVLIANSVQNNTKVLISGDVSGASATISAVGLTPNIYNMVSYVYNSTPQLSQLSTAFNQTVEPNTFTQVTFNGQQGNSSSSATQSFGTFTISAGVTVICVTGAGTATISSVSAVVPHGGATVSPTKLVVAEYHGDQHVAFYSYNNNGGAATMDITATYSSAVNQCSATVWTMTGAAGTTAYQTQISGNNTNNTPTPISLTVPVGGAVFAAASLHSDDGSFASSWTSSNTALTLTQHDTTSGPATYVSTVDCGGVVPGGALTLTWQGTGGHSWQAPAVAMVSFDHG